MTDTEERPFPDREILELVERYDGVMRRRQVAEKLDVSDDDYRELSRQLDRLVAGGLLVCGHGNRYRLPGKGSVLGRLDVKAAGFGFVVPTRGQAHDIYASASVIGDAMDGDLVLAEVTKPKARRGRGPAAARLHIVERAHQRLVGMFASSWETSGTVLPDNRALEEIEIIAGETAGAEVGEKVIVELTEFPRGRLRSRGRVVERLGEAGTLAAETRSVIEQHGLRERFTDSALAETESVKPGIAERDRLGRADYTGELTVTIDPVDAADFDDAVSLVRSSSEGWRVRVHIADVSARVPEGGEIDKEARLRGTSVYLPGHVIPMLPERLTREICCLRPDEDKLVKTATIDISPSGQLTSPVIERSIIRSDRRLSYSEVFAALDRDDRGDLAPEILEMLTELRTCTQAMRLLRKREGAIEFDMPEPRVLFEDGKIASVELRRQNFAHQMVEELMLAANRAVARRLVSLELPGLYRIHEEPDEQALQNFARFAGGCGCPLKRPYDRASIQKVLDHFRGTPDEAAVNIAFLQSMKQARYTEVVRPHWALAFSQYCHFTSPIRRYPDLVVHRALDEAFEPAGSRLVHRKDRPSGGSSERRAERLHRLAHLAEICSTAERKAEKAERALAEFCQLLFLQGRTGTKAKGIITGVEKYGIFVEIEGLSVHGMIHVSELPDGPYRFSRKRSRLENRRSKQHFQFGQEVLVSIESVDLVGKDMRLLIAE